MVLSVATEKSPVIPPGIDPETVRLVAQCLNYYATPGPRLYLLLGISKTDYEFTSTVTSNIE